ncbi:MAG: dodecin domain-containing protein [Candidatus Syntrophonatronum acetioxidans]|uniref:Dodecin domain-containing protein n=1 Tax=Candidatus Syntrophonatronum acetioxidans TaxID=1795816 RepID=A0A424YET0_9FIRM|nr:MAG: dodecin domain-containing protein [Candidatus Syntrophonatronum acetioxidans]
MTQVGKVIELIGSSEKSWEDAANQALQKANETLANISGIEVTDMTATVEGGKIVKYKTAIKVVFTVGKDID